MLTGNKGEWSEIYTFLKLLYDKKLYAADSDLNKIENIYYPIIKILRAESEENLEYFCNSLIHIINGNTNEEILSVPIAEFKEKSMLLLDKIKQSSGASFSVPEIQDFMDNIKCKSLKAKSTDKSDIKIVVHDINTGFKPTLGFSIKSKLGSPSTLLNAGKTTNFKYEIIGENLTPDKIEEINNIQTKSKIRDRLNKIYESGFKIKFVEMENQIFNSNLQVIDSLLPLMISEMLLLFYKGSANTLKDLLEQIKLINPCNFNNDAEHPFYEYKIKSFMTDIALGMTPANTWGGNYDATGGYIVVKENGEVLCYHIYNRNEFQNYLLNSTRFETASSTRHDFGTIYKEKNKNIIKLNLQIRFI